MKDYTLYLGAVAGICTSISMLPQLIKMIKEKKADDISYVMLFVLLTGIGCWAWYGILKRDYPIIIANCFSFLLTLLVVVFSIKYKNKK